jgi:hypothetical protein
LTDTLFLNAENNAGALFVIQINGALSTSIYSYVSLINGTQSQNVYWVVQGAVTINDFSNFSGTIVSNNGAIVVGTGDTLAGRALTTAGNVNSNSIIANDAYGGSCTHILPMNLLSFTAACQMQTEILKWSTTAESNNKYFTVERSADGKQWQEIATIQGAGGSLVSTTYSVTDEIPDKSLSYYRLMLTDLDGNNTYSAIANAESCVAGVIDNFSLYPNPSNGKFSILFSGDKTLVQSTNIYNSLGEILYSFRGFKSDFDLYNQPSGVYIVQLQLQSTILNQEIELQR